MKQLNDKYYVYNKNILPIAYVSQHSFILNGSVCDNILLNLPYNKKKYIKILKYSALSADIKILPNGDLTEIGEQCVTISGGQKMRISFARALYRYDIFIKNNNVKLI